jgi:IS30 family transposase
MNENMNGLVRQYFPKKTDFSKVAVDKLNRRPGKCLDTKTPFEVFFNQSAVLRT